MHNYRYRKELEKDGCGIFLMWFVIIIASFIVNIALLAFGVWVVVKVLQYMGVL